MTAYTIDQAKTPISNLIDIKLPVFLHGPAGLGKSSLVKQLGEEKKREVVDIRLSQLEQSDLRGIPYRDGDLMKWSPPCFLPRSEDSTSIVFLDEFNLAHPSVLSSAYQLILDRRVGEYELPKGVSIVAAGNRAVDSDYVNEMPKPLQNRFTHIELKYDYASWLKYAKDKTHESVLAYLDRNKTELFNGDDSKEQAFPTPRSWGMVSTILKEVGKQASTKEIEMLVSSCVGSTIAKKFVSFLGSKKVDRVDIKEMLVNPEYKDMYKKPCTIDTFLQIKEEWFQVFTDLYLSKIVGNLHEASVQDKTVCYSAVDNSIDFVYTKFDAEVFLAFVRLVSVEKGVKALPAYLPKYSAIQKEPKIKELLAQL